MLNYIQHDEWCVREEGFHAAHNEMTESLMSLGNGRMGIRGNFEEQYSGRTLQGSYLAGVYYPDKTRVGWWKNGYPLYFAKVLNACNWIGIDVRIGGEVLDLHTGVVEAFTRELDMKCGLLSRNVLFALPSGRRVRISSRRFVSMADEEAGAVRYSITLEGFDEQVTVVPYLDGNVRNRDANYDETFWEELKREVLPASGLLMMQTKPNPYGVEQFQVVTGMKFELSVGGKRYAAAPEPVDREKYVAGRVQVALRSGETLTVDKLAVNLTSQNHAAGLLFGKAGRRLEEVAEKGFDRMSSEHAEAWALKWRQSDIGIEGDVAAQQGIRFNIFHLEQTYSGRDDRLNIGPKGFTGEKYGGSTYWDTEAYCLPFYLSASPQDVSRNLLIYRYRHLQKAMENAQKLGFGKGAALYPMVTMNGEECHNEWEITFEEIHRNGAIAYAIYDYIRYTGDEGYLAEYGLEVLIAISRFWQQRFSWSEAKRQFVMLGVTGPNEYENNVNNNWYTNYIANWTLKYTLQAIDAVRAADPGRWATIARLLDFDEQAERPAWEEILGNTFFPVDRERGVFLQQQDFPDKELLTVDQVAAHLPLNQNWSWDRILRSCFIKQADVLQGLYFFEDDFDLETIRRNFAFYEPMTVHESSLSPCVHSVLASRLRLREKAYEMYLRTARLDLDNYNHDTEDGLHITSMAGTWMSVVKGFAGLRVTGDRLSLDPYIPDHWASYNFRIGFRGSWLKVTVLKDKVEVELTAGSPLQLRVNGEIRTVG